jgi:hypothetical protein
LSAVERIGQNPAIARRTHDAANAARRRMVRHAISHAEYARFAQRSASGTPLRTPRTISRPTMASTRKVHRVASEPDDPATRSAAAPSFDARGALAATSETMTCQNFNSAASAPFLEIELRATLAPN